MTTARGTEAILPVAHIMDRTVYGRQQDWEDSPEGWPQEPTYGMNGGPNRPSGQHDLLVAAPFEQQHRGIVDELALLVIQ